jgi:DNA-binding transcriptional regulator/RsmH inhibitor MraZ
MIAGTLGRFEIWNRQRWDDHYQTLRGGFDEFARKVSDLGL